MEIFFENQILLSLFLALLACWALALIVPSFREFAPSFLRVLFIGALLAALAGPYTESVESKSSVTVVLDVSDSMSPDGLEGEAKRVVRKLEDGGWDVDVVPFAGKLGEASSSVSEALSQRDQLVPEHSSLESSLREVIQQTSTDIVLVTDGVETKGSALSLVSGGESGVSRIYPQISEKLLQITERVSIEDVFLPLTRKDAETLKGTVSLVSTLKKPQEGQLFVFQNGQLLSDEIVELKPDSAIVRDISLPYSGSEKDEIEIRFIPSDSTAEVQTQKWFIHADEGKKILLLGQNEKANRYLKEGFESMNFQVSNSLAVTSSGANVLGEFKAIVINNIPFSEIPALVRREARKYVESGGRFILVGGDRSYGLGGYVGTEIDAMMPVASIEPRRELKRINVAVQLVLDKSASMKFGQKIEFSKQAAREVVRSLKDADYFGVIGFDTTPFIAFPIRRLAEFRQMAIQRIGTLFAAGKTNLFPALDEARRGLINTPAGRKHIIVLTDGKIPDEGPHYLQLVQQMRTRGITVSTVMMGSEADTRLLRSMAQYGGGSFYQTRDPRSLPRIFLSDVQVSTKEQTLKEEEEYGVRRSNTARTKTTSLLSFPPVRGFVETKARKDEYIELVVTGRGKASPFLATRTLGKGKTISYTTDANGRWSSYWVGWKNFRKFWRDLVVPPEAQDGEDKGAEFDFDLRWIKRGGNLVLDLIAYEEVTGAVSLTLEDVSGESKEYLAEEVVRGRYQVVLDEVPTGILTVSGKAGEKEFGPLSLDISGDEFGEMRNVGIQTVLLGELASGTGGAVNAFPLKGAVRENSVATKFPLKPYALLLAFLLLALDIIVRTRGANRRGRLTLRPV